MSVKEKQLRTHGKLENLKIQLLHLVGELEETVTYNPFKGRAQSVVSVSGENMLNNRLTEFVHNESQLNPLDDTSIDSDEAQKRRLDKNKASYKQRFAQLV